MSSYDAHAAFVHRDIKPDNMLIDARGHLKVRFCSISLLLFCSFLFSSVLSPLLFGFRLGSCAMRWNGQFSLTYPYEYLLAYNCAVQLCSTVRVHYICLYA